MAEVDGRFENHRLRGIWFEFGLSSLWPEFQRKLQKKALIKQPTKIFGRDGFCFYRLYTMDLWCIRKKCLMIKNNL